MTKAALGWKVSSWDCGQNFESSTVSLKEICIPLLISFTHGDVAYLRSSFGHFREVLKLVVYGWGPF